MTTIHQSNISYPDNYSPNLHLPLVKVNDQFTSTTNTFQLRIVMANWKFLQLERVMLVLRIVASSSHSLKIEKEGVNVEGQRPHTVTK